MPLATAILSTRIGIKSDSSKDFELVPKNFEYEDVGDIHAEMLRLGENALATFTATAPVAGLKAVVVTTDVHTIVSAHNEIPRYEADMSHRIVLRPIGGRD